MSEVSDELLKCLKLRWPILLQGNVGKTYTIRKLASIFGLEENIVELHLDNQTDPKSLFGAFVCSDIPGEFVWRAGVVADAALTGKWIVLENIDKIPLDLIVSMTSLIQQRTLFLPSIGRDVDAHPRFRIFATTSVQNSSYSPLNGLTSASEEIVQCCPSNGLEYAYRMHYQWLSNKNIPSLYQFYYLWHVFHIPSYSTEFVQTILNNLHPTMQSNPIMGCVMHSYAVVEELRLQFSSFQGGAIRAESISSDLDKLALSAVRGAAFSNADCRHLERPCTLNDLIKICARIATRLLPLLNSSSGFVTEEQRALGLIEFLEVCGAYIRDAGVYARVVQVLARCWDISEGFVETRVLQHVPSISVLDSNLFVDQRLRVALAEADGSTDPRAKQLYSMTKQSSRLLSNIAASIASKEPILLVGETGCGKTTAIQQLARVLNKTLVVQNLSLSTDSSDLLGGYKPVTIRHLVLPMYETFLQLFQDTFSQTGNLEFLQRVGTMFRKHQWRLLLKAFSKSVSSSTAKLAQTLSGAASEEVAVRVRGLVSRWAGFKAQVQRFEVNLAKIEQGFAFSYIQGQLVEAIQHGHWILLDEVNLASMETLQCLSGILEGRSVHLLEKGVVGGAEGSGESSVVARHPDFLVFAAMNPPTDVGKKELPMVLRSKFTEIYVNDILDRQDLYKIIEEYVGVGASSSTGGADGEAKAGTLSGVNINDVVDLYLACRQLADSTLSDGASQRPKYTLRTLTRTLKAMGAYTSVGIAPQKRALYESFHLCFGTQLEESSKAVLMKTVESHLAGNAAGATAGRLTLRSNKPPERPGRQGSAHMYTLVKPFWLERRDQVPVVDWGEKDSNNIVRFVITPFVEQNIRDIAAAVAANVAPILLQGPTSVGKTTMIEYLAALTGHKCIRINNHEQTDVEEYLGSYVTSSTGQLVYQDGLLVQALRQGCWIILDELNLAPSDVLEALNRLLDDNKELLISETGELLTPKEGFRLFATQNPPGLYGGRKPLSRAFRNRFIELSISDMPLDEVEVIVTQACGIAPKYSKMLVSTMHELQLRRQKSNILQGKHGSLTVRDLLKWGKRHPQSPLEVASLGYMMVAEKLRTTDEKRGIEEVLNQTCRVTLDTVALYRQSSVLAADSRPVPGSVGSAMLELGAFQDKLREGSVSIAGVSGIAITKAMTRMWTLVYTALSHREAVLLIGETGCGKTTVCQMYASSLVENQCIRILNCHQSTEVMDILGGLRPVRGREFVFEQLQDAMRQLCGALQAAMVTAAAVQSADAEMFLSVVGTKAGLVRQLELYRESIADVALDSTVVSKVLVETVALLTEYKEKRVMVVAVESPTKKRKSGKNKVAVPVPPVGEEVPAVSDEALSHLESLLTEAQALDVRHQSMFEWVDGPLVLAMKQGDIFLLDEVNLAEDAVIERLNSVLESNRELTLAEKGGIVSEKIIAHPNFRFLATMNPGGDYGKRELSPALRSRFTEVYIPNITDADDIVLVIQEIIKFPASFCVRDMALVAVGVEGGNMKTVVARLMVGFIAWLNEQTESMSISNINFSVREIISWANFISQWEPTNALELFCGYMHGAQMLLLDGLGIGMSSVGKEMVDKLKALCLDKLISQCPDIPCGGDAGPTTVNAAVRKLVIVDIVSSNLKKTVVDTESAFSVGGFPLVKTVKAQGDATAICGGSQFVYTAGNTLTNMYRILRAMRLRRPILLEGPPGVGKTSIIANLADITGHRLVRINLSEQSELSDLLGTDVPTSGDFGEVVEGDNDTAGDKATQKKGNRGKFVWNDGVFLAAMKRGDWVLLDELNLAPQSVLEGLNACFDHRGEVYIPEIGQSVKCPDSFRVFCAQNPMGAGGGRKGLPQSFLSRLSRVFVDSMTEADVLEIIQEAFARKLHPYIRGFIPQLVRFMFQLHEDVVVAGKFGHSGSPWEFNLRDLYRLCQVMQTRCGSVFREGEMSEVIGDDVRSDAAMDGNIISPALARRHICEAVHLVFVCRMRTMEDMRRVEELFSRVVGIPMEVEEHPRVLEVRNGGTNVTGQMVKSVFVGLAPLPITFFPQMVRQYVSTSSGDVGDVVGAAEEAVRANTVIFRSKYLESIASCITCSWPVLLVGPVSSGKRNCVRTLAQLTGNKLVEYSLTPSTDSAELLGSFEQTNIYRYVDRCVVHMELAIVALAECKACRVNGRFDEADAASLGAMVDGVYGTLGEVRQLAEEVSAKNGIRMESGQQLLASMETLSGAIAHVNAFVERCFHTSADALQATAAISGCMKSAKAAFGRVVALSGGSVGGSESSDCNFEWVDGVIITALEEGYWLLVSNVNLCSASVLDRLNSLLEINGNILLTESGTGRVVTPHKNFRIFFTMDSQGGGEVSRAMRNRCIEITFLPVDNERTMEQLDAAVAMVIRDHSSSFLTPAQQSTLFDAYAVCMDRFRPKATQTSPGDKAVRSKVSADSLGLPPSTVASLPVALLFRRIISLIKLQIDNSSSVSEDMFDAALSDAFLTVLGYRHFSPSRGALCDATGDVAMDVAVVESEGPVAELVLQLRADMSASVDRVVDGPVDWKRVFAHRLGAIGGRSNGVVDLNSPYLAWLQKLSSSSFPRSVVKSTLQHAVLTEQVKAAVESISGSDGSMSRGQLEQICRIMEGHLAKDNCSSLLSAAVTEPGLIGATMQPMVNTLLSAVTATDHAHTLIMTDLLALSCHAADSECDRMRLCMYVQQHRDTFGDVALLSATNLIDSWWQWAHLVVFDRHSVLALEQMERTIVTDGVDDDASASASSESVYGKGYSLQLAFGGQGNRSILREGIILQVMLQLFRVVHGIHENMGLLIEHLSLLPSEHSSLVHNSASLRDSAKAVLATRDSLVAVLLSHRVVISKFGGLSDIVLPWDELFISTRWVSKALEGLECHWAGVPSGVPATLSRMTDSLRHLEALMSDHWHERSSGSALDSSHSLAIGGGKTAVQSIYAALRRELGHASIPTLAEDWEFLSRLRNQVFENSNLSVNQRKQSSFVNAGSPGAIIATENIDHKLFAAGISSVATALELLYLFATFYWSRSHEVSGLAPADGGDSDDGAVYRQYVLIMRRLTGQKLKKRPAAAVGVASTSSSGSSLKDVAGDATNTVDFGRMLDAILRGDKATEAAVSDDNVVAEHTQDIALSASSQLTASIKAKVRSELNGIGDLTLALVCERWIMRNMLWVSEFLGQFVLTAESLIVNADGSDISVAGAMAISAALATDENLRALLRRIAELANITIRLSVYFGKFNLAYLRELQTLVWLIDAIEANDAHANSRALPLLLLGCARNLQVQINIRAGQMCHYNLMNNSRATSTTWHSNTLTSIASPVYRVSEVEDEFGMESTDPAVDAGPDASAKQDDATEVVEDSAELALAGANHLARPLGLVVSLKHLTVDVLTSTSHLNQLLHYASSHGTGNTSFFNAASQYKSGVAESIVQSLATHDKIRYKLQQIFRLEVFAANQQLCNSVVTRCESAFDAVSGSMRLTMLIQLFVDTIRSCRDNWTVNVCDAVNKHLSASASPDAMEEDGQGCSAPPSAASMTVQWVTALFVEMDGLKLAERCTNSYLAALYGQLLNPMVALMSTIADAASAELLQQKLALAWVYLGAFIAQLLVPVVAIDPSQKYVTKMTLLEAEIALKTNKVVAGHLHSVVSGGPSTVHCMEADSAAVGVLEARVGNYSAEAIYRPRVVTGASGMQTTTPPFAELYYYMRTGMKDVADPARLVQMLKKFQAHFTGDTTRLPVKMLLQEEVTWQKSASSFIVQCNEAYPCYEDITSPFISAIFSISFGLRSLVALAMNSETTDAQSDTMESHLLPMKFACSASGGSSGAFSAMLQDILGSSSDKTPPILQQLLCLQRADTYIGAGIVRPVSGISRALEHILFDYSAACLRQEDVRKTAEIERNKMFKTRESTYDNDDTEVELASLKQSFPQMFTVESDFKDIIDADNARNHIQTAVVEHIEEGNGEDGAPVDIGNSILDAELLTMMVSLHCRLVFLHKTKLAAQTGGLWRKALEGGAAVRSTAPGKKSGHALGATQTSLHNLELYVKNDITLSMLLSKITEVGRYSCSAERDASVKGDSLLAYALMLSGEDCSNGVSLIDSDVFGATGGTATVAKKNSKAAKAAKAAIPQSSVDRDLLYLLDPHTVGTSWKPSNFHKDANRAEAVRIAPVLYQLFERASNILMQFPGNEILEQLCKISVRISLYPVHTPLGLLLAALEFLSRKCDEWEKVASREVSLMTETCTINRIIAQWRELELHAWRELLRIREQQHVSSALAHYTKLHKMLSCTNMQESSSAGASPAVDAAVFEGMTRNGSKEASAVPVAPSYVHYLSESSLFKAESAPAVTKHDEADKKFVTDLFSLVDGFCRSSVLGEFPTRLHMLRLFALQLFQQHKQERPVALPKSGKPNKAYKQKAFRVRLGNIVYSVWRYYEQFLPLARQFQELLKIPIHQKLTDEIKLSKWDAQNTYALIEHSERIHKKLNRLIREYQSEVLDYPMSGILRRELLSEFVNEAGELKESALTDVPKNAVLFPRLLKPDRSNEVDFTTKDEPTTGAVETAVEKKSVAVVENEDPVLGTFEVIDKRLGSSLTLKRAASVKPVSKMQQSKLAVKYTRLFSIPRLLTRVKLHVNRHMILSWSNNAVVLADSKMATANAGIFDHKVRFGMQGAMHFEYCCTEIFSRLHQLRDFTTTVLVPAERGDMDIETDGDEGGTAEPEMVEKEVTTVIPKEAKYRSIRDLFNIMKQEGISSLRSSGGADMKEFVQLFALKSLLSGEIMSDLQWTSALNGAARSRTAPTGSSVPDVGPTSVLNHGEVYFMKCLTELNQMRAQGSGPIHHDVSARDAGLMQGYVDSLFYRHLVQYRAMVGAGLEDQHALFVAAGVVQKLANHQKCGVVSAEGSDTWKPLHDVEGVSERLDCSTQQILHLMTYVRVLLITAAEAHAEADNDVMLTSVIDTGGRVGDLPAAPPTFPEVDDKGTVLATVRAFESIVENLARPTDVAVDASGTDGRTDAPYSNILGVDTSSVADVGQSGAPLASRISEKLQRLVVARESFLAIAPALGGLVSVDVVKRARDVFDSSINQFDSASDCQPTEVDSDSGRTCGAGAVLACLTKTVEKCLVVVQNLTKHSEYNSGDNERRGVIKALLQNSAAVGEKGVRATNARDARNWKNAAYFNELLQQLQTEDLRADEPVYTGAGPDESAKNMTMASYFNMSVLVVASLKIHSLTSDLRALGECMGSYSAGRADMDMDGLLLQDHLDLQTDVLSLVGVVQKLHLLLVEDMALMYKSAGKYLYVVIRIFRNLLGKGICAANTQESDGSGDGSGSGENDISKMKFEDDVEGTGMGEGEGKKDVSDELESEDQLLGTKDEQGDDDKQEPKKQEERKELKEEEKDKGVEMGQDFDGEMFDLPEDKEPQEDEEEDEQEQEELEREMGDANDEDVVDEKEWGSDDEDEKEDGQEQQKDKLEKDSKMKGDKVEDEMITKDDDDDGGDDEERDGKEERDDASEADDDEDGPEGDQEKGPDKINEDREEDYMERPQGVKVQEKEEKEESKEGEEEGEEKAEGEDGEDERDGADQEQQEDGEGEAGPEGEGEDPEDGADADNDLPEQMNLDGDEEEAGEGAEDGGLESENESDPEETAGDDSLEQMKSLGAAEEAENEENPEIEPKEKEEEEAKEDEKPPVEQNKEKKNHKTTFGVQSEQGKDKVFGDSTADQMEQDGADRDDADGTEEHDDHADAGENVAEEQTEEDAEMPSEGGSNSSASDSKSQNSSKSQSSGQDDSSADSKQSKDNNQESSGDPSQQRKRRQQSLQPPPNPFKMQGDVNEEWERRLQLREQEAEEDEDSPPVRDKDTPKDQEHSGRKDRMFEFSSGDAQEQVLAANNDEDENKLPDYKQQDEEGGDKEETPPEGEGEPEPTKSAMTFPKGADKDDAADDDQGAEKGSGEDEGEGEKEEDPDASNKRKRNDSVSSRVGDEDDGRKKATKDYREGEETGDAPDDSDEESEDGSLQGADPDDFLEQESGTAGSNLLEKGALFANTKTLAGPVRAATREERERDGAADSVMEDYNNRREESVDGRQAERLQRSREEWLRVKSETDTYAIRMCEQLRLILEPTLATRLQGDYRSGKRMNMRRVIGYIASGYRKDKIWLRRTKPAKRDYKIMVMIDNSKSMGPAGSLALSSLSMISNALNRLEVGDISVVSFAEKAKLLHPFGQPFTDDAGANIHSQFTFHNETTQLAASLESVIPIFQNARSSSSAGGAQTMQLCFIISDARLDSDNRSELQTLIREMTEQHILVVLVVLDLNKNKNDSILNTKTVEFTPAGKVITKSYLDNFPFPYYLAIQQVESLPDILSDTIKQWFELVNVHNK